MNSPAFPARFSGSWPLIAVLLIAAVWLYRSPYSASNLEVPPDTVEYALAPLQLLETGRYEIMLEGRGLPPRYPPWFPVLVVSPGYVLFGHDPGNAILPITLLAIAGAGFAYAIGKRIGATTGGVFAALTLLILPPYSAWATQVMTDVPCTTLMLATCFLYLRVRDRPGSLWLYFGAGTVIAVDTLFRPVFAAMLLPFLWALFWQRKRTLARAVLLLAPMAIAAAATFIYNAATFGSPFWNGYKFWVAIPMDYPRMIFSTSHLAMNLRVIGGGLLPALLVICVGGWLLLRRQKEAVPEIARQGLGDAAIFFFFTTVPITLFHLIYFFPGDRFHLPMLAGAAVLTGSMLALLIGHKADSLLKLLLPAVFILAIAARAALPAAVPLRRVAADRVRTQTPENAIVISALEPVYLERLAAAGSARRIVPLSRRVEYASKLLVRKHVEDPRLNTLKWYDGRALALIRPHAEDAVHFVASEKIDELAAECARGTPVFLETLFIDESEAVTMAALRERFRLVQRAPFLFQLLPP